MYLYVIAADKSEGPLCKVGVSAGPRARLRTLQTSSPYRLSLVAEWDCGSQRVALAMERLIHKWTKDYRLVGEWFAAPADGMVAYIDAVVERVCAKFPRKAD